MDRRRQTSRTDVASKVATKLREAVTLAADPLNERCARRAEHAQARRGDDVSEDVDADTRAEGLVRRVDRLESAWCLRVCRHLRIASLGAVGDGALCDAREHDSTGDTGKAGIEMIHRAQGQELWASSNGRIDAASPATSETPSKDLSVKTLSVRSDIRRTQSQAVPEGCHGEYHCRPAEGARNDHRRLRELETHRCPEEPMNLCKTAGGE
mmetsp:Transcript_58279/g.147974  ORF Transcript_58279/g.147974 Transcript_58279/m.147974 type:complete len:211 (-) Transcript_58279:40-672(-)